MKKLLILTSVFMLFLTGCSQEINYKNPDVYIVAIEKRLKDTSQENKDLLNEVMDTTDNELSAKLNNIKTNIQTHLSPLTEDEAKSFYEDFIAQLDKFIQDLRNKMNDVVNGLNYIIDNFSTNENEVNNFIKEQKDEFQLNYVEPLKKGDI